MTNEKKQVVALDVAIGMLHERQSSVGYVHTFRQAGPYIVGANVERDRLIAAMREASEIEVTGEVAQKLGHGLAIEDERGLLFIETHDPLVKGATP